MGHQSSNVKGQKDKQRSTKQKNKERTTRTPLKPGMNSGALEGYADLIPLVAPVVLTVGSFRKTNNMMIIILLFNVKHK